jgi:hypothetical protein
MSTIDIMAPFRALAERAAEQAKLGKAFEIEFKGTIELDPEVAEEAPFSLAALLVSNIKHEVAQSALPVSQATRERRARSLKGAAQEGRYPAGFVPNPNGPYGQDSGYLLSVLQANLDANKKDAFVGIPKERAKAAFVLRRLSPTARGGPELAAAVHSSMAKLTRDLVRKTVRKAFRGQGIGVTFK